MAVDPSVLGMTLTLDEPYLVGREKVREFATAVFATAPAHHDVAAARALGYTDVVAPPTFAMVVQDRLFGRLLDNPSLGIELKRAIHAEQRFEYERPIIAGDALDATLEVTALREMRGNTMLTSETRITEPGGGAVVTATSVLLIGGGDAA